MQEQLLKQLLHGRRMELHSQEKNIALSIFGQQGKQMLFRKNQPLSRKLAYLKRLVVHLGYKLLLGFLRRHLLKMRLAARHS
tara:strand:- start:37 stop:282 length:246 start_codon:yes stop_codon:yes gene_type:complete